MAGRRASFVASSRHGQRTPARLFNRTEPGAVNGGSGAPLAAQGDRCRRRTVRPPARRRPRADARAGHSASVSARACAPSAPTAAPRRCPARPRRTSWTDTACGATLGSQPRRRSPGCADATRCIASGSRAMPASWRRDGSSPPAAARSRHGAPARRRSPRPVPVRPGTPRCSSTMAASSTAARSTTSRQSSATSSSSRSTIRRRSRTSSRCATSCSAAVGWERLPRRCRRSSRSAARIWCSATTSIPRGSPSPRRRSPSRSPSLPRRRTSASGTSR